MKFDDDVLLEKGCYQYELLLEFEFVHMMWLVVY